VYISKTPWQIGIISSYHTTNYTLCLSQLSVLTHGCRVFLDWRTACGSSWPAIQVYPIILFLQCPCQYCCLWWGPVGCRGRCGAVSLTRSLPSSCTVSLQRVWVYTYESPFMTLFSGLVSYSLPEPFAKSPQVDCSEPYPHCVQEIWTSLIPVKKVLGLEPASTGLDQSRLGNIWTTGMIWVQCYLRDSVWALNNVRFCSPVHDDIYSRTVRVGSLQAEMSPTPSHDCSCAK
jgi:hypothetical protein